MEKAKARVYLGQIPNNLIINGFNCEKRNEQIRSAKSQKIKKQKYWSWKILLYAIKDYFGFDEADVEFSLEKNGKWSCDKCFFSITHSNGVVAVAVSKRPVGVDIEDETEFKKRRDLCEVKRLALKAKIPINEYVSPYNDFLKGWVLKEAAYKLSGLGGFVPANIEIDGNGSFKIVEKFEKTLYLALAGREFEEICFLDESLNEV